MSVLRDAFLQIQLAALHERSEAQLKSVDEAHAKGGALSPLNTQPDRVKAFVSDKLVALERDKAEFCYQLIRATDARRIVEIGTSYGVSTLYLAAALRDKSDGSRDAGIVIGTEHELEKVRSAREHLQQARLDHLVDIRERDLRDTLQDLAGPIDFVLVDIWTEMARPALAIVYPHLRPGAIVVCDNTNDREAYADYLALIADPKRHFRTMTLPFKGGFEMSVYCPPAVGSSGGTQQA